MLLGSSVGSYWSLSPVQPPRDADNVGVCHYRTVFVEATWTMSSEPKRVLITGAAGDALSKTWQSVSDSCVQPACRRYRRCIKVLWLSPTPLRCLKLSSLQCCFALAAVFSLHTYIIALQARLAMLYVHKWHEAECWDTTSQSSSTCLISLLHSNPWKVSRWNL